MKQLVLITKNYPYDYGEEFLENEISALASAFDRVTVFATAVQNPSAKRPLPKNVTAVPFSISTGNLIFSAIKQLLSKNPMCSVRDRNNIRSNFKKRLFYCYFAAKADRIYRHIKAHCDFSEADEVVFYSYWFYDTALAAARLKNAFGARAKAVSRAHGYDLYEYHSSVHYLPFREYMLKELDGVYPCSQHGADYLNDLCPGHRHKIHTAYLGVTDHGEKLAERDERFTIVSCGYVSAVKRIERIAEALSLIENKNAYRWVHFGGGADLAEIRQFADAHLDGLDCVFKGNVQNSEILDYYRTQPCDLLVNTSVSEGLPVSIMEAQSFGIPAAATDVGGTSEIVLDGKTGFLLDAACPPEALKSVIERVAAMGENEYKTLSENAHRNFSERFNAGKNYNAFVDVISHL